MAKNKKKKKTNITQKQTRSLISSIKLFIYKIYRLRVESCKLLLGTIYAYYLFIFM